jgi:hypothetical protein
MHPTSPEMLARSSLESRAVLSELPVTIQRLSGLIATAQTAYSWPRRTTGLADGSLALRSQSRAVLSQLPVTSHWLSGLMSRCTKLGALENKDRFVALAL